MSFDGVTFSLAGLVVLAFAVLSLSRGEILFGRRIWGKVTMAAALTIGGVAHFKPDEFGRGMTTVVAAKTKEAQKQVQPIIAALASRLLPPSPAP